MIECALYYEDACTCIPVGDADKVPGRYASFELPAHSMQLFECAFVYVYVVGPELWIQPTNSDGYGSSERHQVLRSVHS